MGFLYENVVKNLLVIKTTDNKNDFLVTNQM